MKEKIENKKIFGIDGVIFFSIWIFFSILWLFLMGANFLQVSMLVFTIYSVIVGFLVAVFLAVIVYLLRLIKKNTFIIKSFVFIKKYFLFLLPLFILIIYFLHFFLTTSSIYQRKEIFRFQNIIIVLLGLIVYYGIIFGITIIRRLEKQK